MTLLQSLCTPTPASPGATAQGSSPPSTCRDPTRLVGGLSGIWWRPPRPLASAPPPVAHSLASPPGPSPPLCGLPRLRRVLQRWHSGGGISRPSLHRRAHTACELTHTCRRVFCF